jgi:hypothetical protein
MEFAFAHRLSTLGLSPAAVRFTLNHINKVDEKYDLGIYDPSIPHSYYRLNIWSEVNPPFLFFDGEPPEHILENLRKKITPYSDIWGDGTEPREDIFFPDGDPIYPPSPEEYARGELRGRVGSFNDNISYMGETIGEERDMGGGQVWYEDLTPTATETFYISLEGYMMLNFEAIRSKVFKYASR